MNKPTTLRNRALQQMEHASSNWASLQRPRNFEWHIATVLGAIVRLAKFGRSYRPQAAAALRDFADWIDNQSELGD